MSRAADIEVEIEKLSAERSRLWADGQRGDDVKRISEKLAGLFEEKRTFSAGAGTPKARAVVERRAAAEKELDRLMKQP